MPCVSEFAQTVRSSKKCFLHSNFTESPVLLSGFLRGRLKVVSVFVQQLRSLWVPHLSRPQYKYETLQFPVHIPLRSDSWPPSVVAGSCWFTSLSNALFLKYWALCFRLRLAGRYKGRQADI